MRTIKTIDRSDSELMGPIMDTVRAMGRAAYPSPIYDRVYQLPPTYPSATTVKQGIVDPLGVMLFAIEHRQQGAILERDIETQTASYMVRHKAWKFDFPLYMVTEELASMLLQTDRLDQPNVDTDSKPPFPAGFFVPPKHLLGVASGAYATLLGYAVLEWGDAEGTPIRFPDSMRSGRRLYITAEMSDGTGYYAKLVVTSEGEVQNPKDSPYVEDSHLAKYGNPSVRQGGAICPPLFVVEDGPAMLDVCSNFILGVFTYLNMDRVHDTVVDAVCLAKAKAKPKKNRAAKEFWVPAKIGVNLSATGCATQGSHASPHSHIRRGHWQRVWFGRGKTQVKRVWIKPTLVLGSAKNEK